MESFGIKDPTGIAKNYVASSNTEKSLKEWRGKNNKLLISGHTHHPIYPKIVESLYFNDGSAIHPNGITCLEIEYGKISQVRW